MISKRGLDIVGIPTLFQSISDERKQGNLKIQSSHGEKYIYFSKGKILQVSSPQNPSILAEGLRRHPDLDEESYQVLCEQQKRTGQSLASLLLADEEDGPALVTAICQFQILEEICELFTWQDCHSEFFEGDPDPMLFDLEILDIEPMDIGVVLLEAARRSDEWKMILDKLPSKKDVPYQVKQLPTDANTEQQQVFAAVDGFRNIEDLLTVVRLSPFGAMSAMSELSDQENIALKNSQELLHLTRLDVFREDLTKRTKLYERAIELGEKSPEITVWLAHSYESMGMRDKAAGQYSELGYFYLHSQKYQEAAEAFQHVTDLNPDNLEAQERLVTLLARIGHLEEFASKSNIYARWLSVQGQQDRAILLLKEATEKYPENIDNLELLGSLYQEAGHNSESISTYQSVARLRNNEENYESAAKAYQKIVAIDPTNLQAKKSLGEELERLGRKKEAVEQYRTIGRMVYARESQEQGDSEYLEFASQRIIENEPDNLHVRKWLADAYLARKGEKEAIAQLQEILQRIDEKQNPDLLVDALKSLVTLEPKDLQSRFKLADTYLKIKKEREAVQEYFALGTTAVQMNEISKALEAYDRLLSFDPANYASHLKKAEILMQEDRPEEAIQALMLTGYLSTGSDKLWQAVKAFRQVLSIDRNANINCYLELGKLYKKLGKSKEAIAAFKKHVQKNVKISNFGEALTSCDKILEIDADHEWAQSAKQKLVDILPKLNEVFQEG